MKTGSEAEMKRDLHDTVTLPRIWGMLYKKREEKAEEEKAEEEKAEEGEELERQQEAPDGRAMSPSQTSVHLSSEVEGEELRK
jgi:hypothetical protein